MTARRRVSPALAPDRSVTVEQEFQSFSYIVSHDLAASFRLVGEFSRLLLTDLGDGLTDRQKIYAGHIQAAAGNGQLMLDQLLAFSRVQQKPLEKVRHDADAVMRFCLLKLNAQVSASGAEVTLDPLGEIQADPKLMGTAFNAVLDNAIKFRRPEAPLRIRIGPAHDRGAWRIRVQDNGRGVEPAHREKAFEMFRRLGHDEGLAGVGAGLAICRRIARRHGGDAVFLDCAEGACVELSLPRR